MQDAARAVVEPVPGINMLSRFWRKDVALFKGLSKKGRFDVAPNPKRI